MAPVAGRVANADEEHFVFVPCFLQSRSIPGVPIHRIVCVLQQVRTCFVDQAVGGFFVLHGQMAFARITFICRKLFTNYNDDNFSDF
jgi:hypothetical protein